MMWIAWPRQRKSVARPAFQLRLSVPRPPSSRRKVLRTSRTKTARGVLMTWSFSGHGNMRKLSYKKRHYTHPQELGPCPAALSATRLPVVHEEIERGIHLKDLAFVFCYFVELHADNLLVCKNFAVLLWH